MAGRSSERAARSDRHQELALLASHIRNTASAATAFAKPTTVVNPNLEILPAAQQQLWSELTAVPREFVLYGGTALALRFGHRVSVDFDFFSSAPFQPEELQRKLEFADGCETLQSSPNTLTVLVNRGSSVKVSFFGNLSFGQVHLPDVAPKNGIKIASASDIFATKLKTVLQRSEMKDYLDIAAILRSGISLETGLGCARAIYGETFNTLLPQKALCYFEDGDLRMLPAEVRELLTGAVQAVQRIPIIKCHSPGIGAF